MDYKASTVCDILGGCLTECLLAQGNLANKEYVKTIILSNTGMLKYSKLVSESKMAILNVSGALLNGVI